MYKPVIHFVKTHPDAKLPEYKTPGSAGMDLYSVEDVTLWPGEVQTVDTGLKIQLPLDYEAQIRPRSGLSLKGITVANTPGTIDSDYRGQLKVIIAYNRPASRTKDPEVGTFHIKKGDRIAQLVLAKYSKANCVEVDSLDETSRGEGGFGSTGR